METSSLQRLSVAMSGLQIIKYFSQIHKLHLLDALQYDLARFKIFHLIFNLILTALLGTITASSQKGK